MLRLPQALPRPKFIATSDIKVSEKIQGIILPIFIVCIGTISIIGHRTHNSSLFELGLTTAASPIPLPFTDYKNNQENFAYQYIVHVRDGNKINTFNANSVMLNGPHKQKISFMSSIMFSPLQIPLYKNALFFNICQNNTTVLSALHLRKISSVIIDITSPINNSHELAFITCQD